MYANEQESIIAEAKVRLKERRLKKKERFNMSGVGFEPTPPFGDQNASCHSNGKGISP